MSFMDRFRGGKKATLPRGAKVVRRRHRNGRGTDTGYWYDQQFFLLDGTLADSYDYASGTGDVLSTREAQAQLSDAGYDSNDYTAPSAPASDYSYGSVSDISTAPSSSYDGDYSSGKSSYDSGYSSSSSDSGYSGSSYDSGSSSGYSGGSSSSDSGYSSSSDSSSSW